MDDIVKILLIILVFVVVGGLGYYFARKL